MLYLPTSPHSFSVCVLPIAVSSPPEMGVKYVFVFAYYKSDMFVFAPCIWYIWFKYRSNTPLLSQVWDKDPTHWHAITGFTASLVTNKSWIKSVGKAQWNKCPWLPCALFTQLWLSCDFPLEINAKVQLYRVIKLPELGALSWLGDVFQFQWEMKQTANFTMEANI